MANLGKNRIEICQGHASAASKQIFAQALAVEKLHDVEETCALTADVSYIDYVRVFEPGNCISFAFESVFELIALFRSDIFQDQLFNSDKSACALANGTVNDTHAASADFS